MRECVETSLLDARVNYHLPENYFVRRKRTEKKPHESTVMRDEARRVPSIYSYILDRCEIAIEEISIDRRNSFIMPDPFSLRVGTRALAIVRVIRHIISRITSFML